MLAQAYTTALLCLSPIADCWFVATPLPGCRSRTSRHWLLCSLRAGSSSSSPSAVRTTCLLGGCYVVCYLGMFQDYAETLPCLRRSSRAQMYTCCIILFPLRFGTLHCAASPPRLHLGGCTHLEGMISACCMSPAVLLHMILCAFQ